VKPTEARLAELLAGLGVATDLAAGLEMETSARATLLATALAREVGVRGAELVTVYYTALLRFVGCTSFAHETAWYAGGDDLALLGGLMPADAGSFPSIAGRIFREAGRGQGALTRTRSIARLLSDPKIGRKIAVAHCDQAVALAGHLGAPEGVVESLGQIYERWDGKGHPHGVCGKDLALPARLFHVALRAEVHRRIEGPAAAVAVLEARRGGELDPDLTSAFLRRADDLLALATLPSVWEAVLAAEPTPHRLVPSAQLVPIAEAFGRFADLKSPFTLGHASGVAERAVRAAEHAGLSDDQRETLRIAALLHDLGRVTVPNGIWDKPGPLGALEVERVRMHAWQTERILARCPLLAPFARLAGAHHERLDGSGYHRNAEAAALSPAARLLAAADVHQALLEERPHRPARSAADAARTLSEEAGAGRLGREAVAAVLESTGTPAPPRDPNPAGLSSREVEVLCLVARGLSNKEIGARLFVSARTVGNHVAHIYDKTGVRTRAAAALFAVQNELLGLPS
jgi:HD-GYP domain-containing protein (c-di-GMP phosphodiesterase class II)/DNA-binding CsgD family transcriptional regulator